MASYGLTTYSPGHQAKRYSTIIINLVVLLGARLVGIDAFYGFALGLDNE